MVFLYVALWFYSLFSFFFLFEKKKKKELPICVYVYIVAHIVYTRCTHDRTIHTLSILSACYKLIMTIFIMHTTQYIRKINDIIQSFCLESERARKKKQFISFLYLILSLLNALDTENIIIYYLSFSLCQLNENMHAI